MSDQAIEVRKAHLKGIPRLKDPTGFPETIAEVLNRTASLFSDRGIQLGDRSGRRFERYTYKELREHASRYGSRWRAAGVGKGDRILICQNTSWDFIGAWLGAI